MLKFTRTLFRSPLFKQSKFFRPFSSKPTPPPSQTPSPPQQNFDEIPNKDTEPEDENSFFNEGKKSYYIFITAAAGLVAAYAMMQTFTVISDKKNDSNSTSTKIRYTGKAQIGGPWELIDMQGDKVTHKDFEGSYYLIYFGFCNCPDICPLTLHKLSKALIRMEKMPEKKYFDLKCLFVSVDPDRDTPEKIKRFLDLFEYKKIIGLTGLKNDAAELKKIMQDFKIYATKIYYEQNEKERTMKNAYTIDHTIITYLMDPQNNYVTYIGSNVNEFDMASNIVDAVMDNERNKIKKMN